MNALHIAGEILFPLACLAFGYSRGYARGIKYKDAEWNDGFITGAKEVGLTRDNSGRFRSLKGIGNRVPVGATRKLEFTR